MTTAEKYSNWNLKYTSQFLFDRTAVWTNILKMCVRFMGTHYSARRSSMLCKRRWPVRGREAFPDQKKNSSSSSLAQGLERLQEILQTS